MVGSIEPPRSAFLQNAAQKVGFEEKERLRAENMRLKRENQMYRQAVEANEAKEKGIIGFFKKIGARLKEVFNDSISRALKHIISNAIVRGASALAKKCFPKVCSFA